MRRVAPLLRALLCLVLLANGIAFAHAATRMAVPASPQASDDAGAPPCHGSPDDTASSAGAEPAHGEDGTGLPDCCRSGACDGFCSQHAPALARISQIDATPVPGDGVPAYRIDRHASARLPHRHRPPIPAA